MSQPPHPDQPWPTPYPPPETHPLAVNGPGWPGQPAGYPAPPASGYPPPPSGYPPPPSGYPAPPSGYPPPGSPFPPPYAVNPAMPTSPDEVLPSPVAVLPVVGTPYGLGLVPMPPTTSGRASASLATGVASIVVSFAVTCFGLVGVQNGWGPMVAGAFALLSVFAGVAGILLGRHGLRQAKAGAGAVRGRGMAIGGITCAAIGIALTAVSFVASLLLTSADH